MLLMQAQENGVVLDDEQLLFLADGSGQAYDDEVDEEPVQDLAQNGDNIFQADHIDAFDFDSGPSYDSGILSKVHKYDIDLDTIGVNHEYVQNNAALVVQGEVSSIPNDDVLKLINDMHEQVLACHAFNEQHRAINESLTAELAR
ncbi:hypothetical protein Tco_0130404 [Tanacetum coccineum]